MSKYKNFIEPDNVDTLVLDTGSLVKWLSEPKVTGSKRMSFGVVIIGPGTAHATHKHPGVEELLYVISGEGEQSVANESRHVRPGMLVSIPPGIDHKTANTSWEPLRLIVVYSPTGPEDELRKQSDVCKSPAEMAGLYRALKA